jgi:hypothetical protein
MAHHFHIHLHGPTSTADRPAVDEVKHDPKTGQFAATAGEHRSAATHHAGEARKQLAHSPGRSAHEYAARSHASAAEANLQAHRNPDDISRRRQAEVSSRNAHSASSLAKLGGIRSNPNDQKPSGASGRHFFLHNG